MPTTNPVGGYTLLIILGLWGYKTPKVGEYDLGTLIGLFSLSAKMCIYMLAPKIVEPIKW